MDKDQRNFGLWHVVQGHRVNRSQSLLNGTIRPVAGGKETRQDVTVLIFPDACVKKWFDAGVVPWHCASVVHKNFVFL